MRRAMSTTQLPLRRSATTVSAHTATIREPPPPAQTVQSISKPWSLDKLPVTFEDVAIAATRIRTGIARTELTRSFWLSELCGCEIFLKHELKQFTGSFKERGARNALMSLTKDQAALGVIAASAGNHALALAWHGRQMGIPVTVLMPEVAPLAKVERCRVFGANVIIHGKNIGEAKTLAETDTRFEGLRYINGYNDPEIVAGAGTMGLEIMEQCPDVDYCMIPTGGCGLLAGTAMAMKTIKESCTVVAVEPMACPSFAEALKAGEPVFTPTDPTLADGLAVPTVGGNAFLVAREFTDKICAVGEHEVALAVLRLVESEKLVVEGGGATGLSAILPGGSMHEEVQGKKVDLPQQTPEIVERPNAENTGS